MPPAFLNAALADCTPSSSHPTSSSTAPVVSPLLRVFGRQRNHDDAKICSWLAGVENDLDVAPVLGSGQRSRVTSLDAGTLNMSSNARAPGRDATETDIRSVSGRSGHAAPSSTSKSGSSSAMSCVGTSAQAETPFLSSSTVMTTPCSTETELQSIATSQVPLPSNSPSEPDSGCHVRDDGRPSVHCDYPEPSRAGSMSSNSTRSSGPDRLTPSPVTTSSSSSRPHPIGLSAVPVDLQLPRLAGRPVPQPRRALGWSPVQPRLCAIRQQASLALLLPTPGDSQQFLPSSIVTTPSAIDPRTPTPGP
ncbi:uncharacterized protein B0H18DRAFT_417385 [Fomitopsis serialis]|uniref:uncharacterized protein n=1 Tax=Fomitopsis serialis TaxID=139415 RepID=UPI002008D79C|nr:uncharacterized protein B0H18DRAFT_417385 [Neoantrodia serialis]KAH9935581.1 hypothetical protein B0H18DRAFT_417385 [Neoantrodia serialis]